MLRFFNRDIAKKLPNLCINCKHFIDNKLGDDDYDPDYDHDYGYNNSYTQCKLFGTIDLVKGEIEYDYAKTVRENKDLCGENGKYYEK